MTTCLTCTNAAEPAGSIPICNNGTIQGALAKHFWFSEDEWAEAVLCQPCWSKIDDFHQFYCEVERTHSHQSDHPINVLEIKQEQQFIPEYEASDIKCEREDVDDDDDDDEDASEDGEETDEYCPNEKEDVSSAEESDPDFKEGDTGDSKDKPVRKRRKRLTKAEQAKVNEFVAKHLKLDCSACSKKHPTFDSLQKHSMANHEKRATIICCERKFCQKSRFFDHIRYHLDPDQFQCSKCPKRCPNGEALKNHMYVKHATEGEKIYQCDGCPKKFAQKKLVTAHRRRCHAESNFESENDSAAANDDNDPEFDAGDEVSDEEELPKEKGKTRVKPNPVGRPVKSWQKTIKDEEFIAQNINLECDTCLQKHDTFQELQKHSMDEHEKRAFVRCCDRKFTRKPRLIDHIQFHLNPMQFRCDICSKQFKHSEALGNHKAQRHAEEESKTFRCSMCPKTFSRQKFLNIHEKYHRKINEKNWHCQKCDKYFAFESLLRQHDRLVHTKEFSYVCHICARGFQVLSSYSSHLASHDEEAKRDRPPEERVQCSECNIWVYKQNFRKHMLRHSGTQTCDVCGQECKSVMALRYHKAQHKRDDCFCSICGKTFKKRLTLKEHMASHTGEVLYSCDFCDRTFNSHANRASHRKRMHPKEWLEDKLRKNPNFVQEQKDLNVQLQESITQL
ncbi:transcription factor grauzone-like [Ochlerotatus camptorhynchus]|uniref:transcription factor grauzone-like n=1 Tax=Ochlerotatus camptorhynchus TaxID=644619 RepID=UPI0031CE8B70